MLPQGLYYQIQKIFMAKCRGLLASISSWSLPESYGINVLKSRKGSQESHVNKYGRT